MLSGALLRIPDDLEIERLNGVSWQRPESGENLRSVIQFQERPLVVDRDTTAEVGLAIHQEIERQPALTQENGRYSILYHDTVATRWAHIHVLRGLVVVDKLGNRSFVRQTINNGLNLAHRAHDVSLDTTRMAIDHADQWVRGFSERRGRVARGTVYGEGVEQDAVFGPELHRSTSKAVGWTTNFFGTRVKVKVSPRGGVTVWSWPPMELFLRFLRMEILPYLIALY